MAILRPFAGCLLFFLCLTAAVAQERTEVSSVHGEWVVSNDITLPEAREKAIAAAKAEALRKAGVPERVTESSLLYRSDSKTSQAELFESITSVDVFGEVAEYTVLKEDKKFNEVGNLIYEVWIDATVVIHKDARDAGFTFSVSGVHEKYKSPDKLVFDIVPAKNAYLTAFVISGNEGARLYPNRIEKNEMLKAGVVRRFPGTKSLEYEVSTEKDREINYVILLITKQEVPFMLEETPNNILKFISQINPGEKAVKTYSLMIQNEQ